MTMLNPWRRNREPVEKASADLLRAREELAVDRAETPKFQALARALRELRETNHLAASLTHKFQEPR